VHTFSCVFRPLFPSCVSQLFALLKPRLTGHLHLPALNVSQMTEREMEALPLLSPGYVSQSQH
jgi:hypothetical protein